MQTQASKIQKRSESLATLALIAAIVVFCIVIILRTNQAQGQTTYAQQLEQMGAKVDDALVSKDAQIATMTDALHDLVPPSTDLASLWPASDSILRGTSWANYGYHQTGNAIIKSGGFAGSNNSIALTPVQGGSSGIILANSSLSPITFSGAMLTGPAVAFRIYGDPKAKTSTGFLLRDLTFDRSLGEGINLDAWADNAKIQDCHFGTIGGDGVYVTSDNCEIVDCDFAGSQGEHCIRFDINGSTNHRPANASILNCTFVNHNPQGKECLAIRECDTLFCGYSTFDGWGVGTGQSGNDKNWHARHIVFFQDQWKTLRPGGALAQIEHDCTDIVFDGCTFPGSLTDPAIIVNARANVTLRNCKLICPAGVDPSKLKPIAVARDPSAVISGIETTTIVTQPSTQPTTRPN